MEEDRDVKNAIASKVITTTGSKAAKILVEAGAKELGTRHVARVTTQEAARYAAVVASQKGLEATASGIMTTSQAAARYATKVAASQATAQVWTKVATNSVGVITTPLIECAALKLDGKKHTGAEYAEAGVRGAVTGASGAVVTVATSAALTSLMTGAAAGAAAGSVVPGPGTLAGAVIGLVAAGAGAGAGAGVNYVMKKTDAVHRIARKLGWKQGP
ncbi:hypothetical protein SUDANB32_06444 [Streptomyces sp. enrichment culture]|uniref:hypothetical protein n=1 Tax=Streptomyces sp. enrichment culture TaxID=1795815 RepID=UPI003F56999A